MTKLDDYRLRTVALDKALERLQAAINDTKAIPEHYVVDEARREAYFAGLVQAQSILVDVKIDESSNVVVV